MSISYRLKKKELILLLDLFGNPESLEQKFGDVYISRDEYEKTALSLHDKGYITVTDGRIKADNAAAFIIKNIYDSGVVLADENADGWLYCSDDIIIFADLSPLFSDEFRIRTAVTYEERHELCEELGERNFIFLRGGKGRISGEEINTFTGERL